MLLYKKLLLMTFGTTLVYSLSYTTFGLYLIGTAVKSKTILLTSRNTYRVNKRVLPYLIKILFRWVFLLPRLLKNNTNRIYIKIIKKSNKNF